MQVVEEQEDATQDQNDQSILQVDRDLQVDEEEEEDESGSEAEENAAILEKARSIKQKRPDLKTRTSQDPELFRRCQQTYPIIFANWQELPLVH